MDVRSIAERVLALPQVRFVMAVLDTYGKAPGGILANGLAFAALFSALPTTLLLLGIGGLVAQDPAFQAQLAGALAEAFPPLADLFEEALSAVSQGPGSRRSSACSACCGASASSTPRSTWRSRGSSPTRPSVTLRAAPCAASCGSCCSSAPCSW